MRLSAPVHHLKRRARQLRRAEGIPLHAALDRIAAREGYRSWSLLAAKYAQATPAQVLFSHLVPGDLTLLAARPGQGKTLMGLALAAEAVKAGHRSAFLTLEYNPGQVGERLHAIGFDPAGFEGRFDVDCSDAISAPYIIEKLALAERGTLSVVDYLQLLDQKRETPELARQLAMLKAFARERGLIFVFISQIDRSFDLSGRPFPGLADVRQPNPLDLKLFDKTCFLNRGEMRVQVAA